MHKMKECVNKNVKKGENDEKMENGQDDVKKEDIRGERGNDGANSEAKDNIVSEANEESFSQQEENDQIVLSQEETAEDEISDAATSEEIATPTDVKPSEEEVITPVIKLQETGNTNVTEENNKAQEFTQFGRKSRVSSESREELIRKALLKNGAM